MRSLWFVLFFLIGAVACSTAEEPTTDESGVLDDAVTTDTATDDEQADQTDQADLSDGSDLSDEIVTDQTPDTDTCDPCPLTVVGGYGSGDYAAGTVVHLWADLMPERELLTQWTGDADLLDRPAEWHTTLVMPPRPATVEAVVETRNEPLTETTFSGSTSFNKTLLYYAPAAPVGLILFLHGTGGNSGMILKSEARYIAAAAIARGYAVASFEAEEVVQGDLDGNDKERWDPGLTADNIDFANLDLLVAWLRDEAIIGAQTPLYTIGMSNGGAMSVGLGAVAASSIAAQFPNLRFGAVVSYCAGGRAASADITTTPTAWLLCAHDDNEEVSNDEAIANSATLAAHGIDTVVDLHPASPLYDERFARIEGLSVDTSRAIAAELRTANFVGADGLFTTPTDDIVAAVQAVPSSFPTTLSLPGEQLKEVVGQIKVMQAEHYLYADWASRTLDFINIY